MVDCAAEYLRLYRSKRVEVCVLNCFLLCDPDSSDICGTSVVVTC